MRFNIISAVFCAFLGIGMLVVSGCGTSETTVNQGAELVDKTQSEILATYDGFTLDRKEYEARYTRTSGEKKAGIAQPMSEYEDFLQRYVNFKLKVTDAIAKGLDTDPELLKELKQYRDQLARPYLVEQEVVDSLVMDVYNKQQEQIRASHILVQVDENATPTDTLAAFQKISSLVDSVSTGMDFSDVAFKYSEDPSAKRNKGDLGFFSGGRMILAFEEMAYNTLVGESSVPFRTRFGYHVLNVTDRKPAEPEIRASHILIRTSGPDTTEAFETILSLQQRIASGEDFTEIATQYSEDTGSGKKGGDLDFFPKDRMVPAFGEVAYSLSNIGDVSEPVKTRYGYHLIKLTDRKSLPTYEEAYDDVKKIVKRLPRAAQREEELGAKFRMENGSSFMEGNITALLAGVSDDSLNSHFQSAQISPAILNSSIGLIASDTFSGQEFVDWYRALRPMPSIRNQEQLRSTMERFLNVKAIDVASNSLEDRNREFKDLMNEYRDGIILFRVMEDSVWNRATEDTLGQRAYYNARSTSYQFPERKRILSFYSAKDSLLKEIDLRMKAGEGLDLTALLEADAIFKTDTTFVSDSTNSIYDRALPLSPGESSEIAPYRRGHILLFVDGVEAPRQKSFKEARAEVITGFQDQLEAEWVERLRARYNAKVYPENLVGVFPMADPASSE